MIGSILDKNNGEAKRGKITTQQSKLDTKPEEKNTDQQQRKNQNKPKNEEKPISNLKWSGKVSSVSETFGTLSLQVKMNPDTFTSDLLVRLKDSERTKAMEFQEGDRVIFIGILDDWGTLMPITLDKGEITK